MSNAQEVSGIDFVDSSWEEALLLAKKDKKAIFLYAFTPSCRYCRQMEKEVFTNLEVAKLYNSRFINYKINIDDGAEGEALAKEYAIVGFPTYVFFSQNGELLHQSASAKPASEFILDAKDAFNPQKALFTLKRRYDSGEKSPSLLFNYSSALSSYMHADSPEEQVVKEYLDTQSAKQLQSEKNLRYIFEKHLSFNSPATQYFLKHQSRFTQINEEEEVNRKAQRIITRTATLAGRVNDTKLLEEIEQTIKANFANTNKVSSLAKIYYYQGQKEWLKYAQATMNYADKYADDDIGTLVETATYLKHFSKEKQPMEIGAKIMEKVISTERNYTNLLLYAHLLQKAGKADLALDAAREAIKVAKATGEDNGGATKLISELQQAK